MSGQGCFVAGGSALSNIRIPPTTFHETRFHYFESSHVTRDQEEFNLVRRVATVSGPRVVKILVLAYTVPYSISSLEMLDEVEELDLVLAHYAVTWGLKLPSGHQLGSPSKWVEWGLKAPAYTDHPDSDSD